MAKSFLQPDLAFRLYRVGDRWPFIDQTMLKLPNEADEEELPGDWVGWKGQRAVALLSTYPAEGRICGVEMEAGDVMLFLRVAMEEDEVKNMFVCYLAPFNSPLGN